MNVNRPGITHTMRNLLFTIVLILVSTNVMAIEEAKYTVVKQDGKFELRDYAPHIVAETLVDGDIEEAGKTAFRRLFRYISGENQASEKVAMTAPVSQSSAGEKIAMTAPVGQQNVEGRWAVSFMMPASYTMETLPKPNDPQVVLRQVPAQKIAAVRYSGFWSEEGYLANKQALETWIQQQGFTVVGEPIWARYNSPFSLWFLRRNEVLIPVSI
jgi:hypothetical protein